MLSTLRHPASLLPALKNPVTEFLPETKRQPLPCYQVKHCEEPVSPIQVLLITVFENECFGFKLKKSGFLKQAGGSADGIKAQELC